METGSGHCFLVFANKNMETLDKNRCYWQTITESYDVLWVTPYADRFQGMGKSQVLEVDPDTPFDKNFSSGVRRIEELGYGMFTPVADDDLVHRPDEVERLALAQLNDERVRAVVFDHDHYCFGKDGQVCRSGPICRFNYVELPRFVGITYKTFKGMADVSDRYLATNHAYAGLLYRACPQESIVMVHESLFSYYMAPGRTWNWTDWPRVHKGIVKLAAELLLDDVAPEVVGAWLSQSYSHGSHVSRLAGYNRPQKFLRRLCRSVCKRAKILPPP